MIIVKATNYMDLSGYFIISSPSQEASIFAKKVIYIIQHDINLGSTGIMINHSFDMSDKTLHVKADNTVMQLNDLAVNYGGPVATDRGFILHSVKKTKFDTNPFIKISSDLEMLKKIVTNRKKGKKMFVFGYCSWQEGQLEEEIFDDHWLITKNIDNSIIFDTKNEIKWDAALATMNISPLFYSHLGVC